MSIMATIRWCPINIPKMGHLPTPVAANIKIESTSILVVHPIRPNHWQALFSAWKGSWVRKIWRHSDEIPFNHISNAIGIPENPEELPLNNGISPISIIYSSNSSADFPPISPGREIEVELELWICQSFPHAPPAVRVMRPCFAPGQG